MSGSFVHISNRDRSRDEMWQMTGAWSVSDLEPPDSPDDGVRHSKASHISLANLCRNSYPLYHHHHRHSSPPPLPLH